MEIIFKSYHGINVESNEIEKRNITEAFNGIIKDMLYKIMNNPSVKRYKTQDDRAAVANVVKDTVIAERKNAVELYENYTDEIAMRLLREEVIVQNRMAHLNGVQKGSLIQALIKSDDEQYKYLIAKVEHTNYVDEVELVLKGGFNPDENKIWKTCIFSCDEIDDEIDVSEAKVFLNHTAAYWTEEFLELVEMKSDEKNTKDAWISIEKVLKKELKKDAISDYFVLRSAVISYFRRPHNIDYHVMIEDIFKDYCPLDIDTMTVEKVKSRLLKLPEEYDFDTNFISKPTVVKAKIKSVHKVNRDIEIIIREGLGESPDEYKDIIHVDREPNGSSWLKINVTDEETLNTFDFGK